MEELLNKQNRIILPFLLGRDKLRFLGTKRIKHRMKGKDENALSAAIVSSLSQLDIQEYLSSQSKDVLEQAGSIARTFNKDVLDIEHLMYVLVDSQTINGFIEKNGINVVLLKDTIAKRIERGIIPDFILRKRQIKISSEVELLLKDTLGVTRSSFSLIKPFHIFLELVKKDYPKISKILREADIQVENFVQKLEDENNKSN